MLAVVQDGLHGVQTVHPDYLAAVLRSSLTLAQTCHMMTGNTHPRLTNEDVADLTIPVPSYEVQAQIAIEVARRREQARRLRADAEFEWNAAKVLFEQHLLGGYSFTLEQAIGVCLVPYDYYVRPVDLAEEEIDRWLELTDKIKKQIQMDGGRFSDDNTFLQMLLQRRRLILESAEGKLGALRRLLEPQVGSLLYTLIYATDKDPKQLQSVNQMLREMGVRFHELTSEETASRDLTARVLGAFQQGDLQVLTATRVLDEGVNIPQISRAYILASTTVERQWTQRRGRLLRKCAPIIDQTGK